MTDMKKFRVMRRRIIWTQAIVEEESPAEVRRSFKRTMGMQWAWNTVNDKTYENSNDIWFVREILPELKEFRLIRRKLNWEEGIVKASNAEEAEELQVTIDKWEPAADYQNEDEIYDVEEIE